MPELAKVETQKTVGFVDRGYTYEKRQAKIKAEEEEIAKLESNQRGDEKEEVAEKKEADTESKEEALSPEEKSFKKRYGDLRRHMNEKEKDWKEKFESLEKRLEKNSAVPPKSKEEIEKWVKEYPDVAGVVESMATEIAQGMFNKADKRLKELDKVQTETQRISAEAEIRKSHSDFDDLRNSDEFHDWADEQPKWVKDALYENSDDPASVVRVIDLYKIDKGLTKDVKKANTKAAASVVSKPSKANIDTNEAAGKIKESDVAKMSDKEFAEKEKEINDALRSGKFIYDISGSAR